MLLKHSKIHTCITENPLNHRLDEREHELDLKLEKENEGSGILLNPKSRTPFKLRDNNIKCFQTLATIKRRRTIYGGLKAR